MSDPAATDPPDALAALDDYASGLMPEAEAEAFEEELFARAARGEAPEASFTETLRRAAEWIQTRRGSFEVGSTRAEVDRLLASGARITYMDFGDCTKPVDIPPLDPKLDFFIYRVGVDLRAEDYDTIDVVVETERGEYIKTFRDVRYDATDGAFYGICEGPLAEISFRRGTAISKVMIGRGTERRRVATLETRPMASSR
ncbi:MAG TPA: hypothetical protein VFV94_19795 [Polyangiaceae bacterium]|nr:hypothetical protein [Polyangiaceae bacterium]